MYLEMASVTKRFASGAETACRPQSRGQMLQMIIHHEHASCSQRCSFGFNFETFRRQCI